LHAGNDEDWHDRMWNKMANKMRYGKG